MRLIDADKLLKDIADFPYGYRGMIKSVIANQTTIYPPAGYRVLPNGDGWEYRGVCTASDYLDDNGRVINNPTTIEAELVRHGHWVVDEDGNIKCSECGYHGVGDNYCERCGAKMDEENR